MTVGGIRVVALEEHYWDPEIAKHLNGESRAPALQQRLLDLGELRLREMDEAGIDLQVISHGNPGVQNLDPAVVVPLARQANDGLFEFVSSYPERFGAFATLPTPEPEAAADELERAVTELGFRGALINGSSHGVFFDDPRFWPICERAQALDVPLYLHPSNPHPAIEEVYLKDYLGRFPGLRGAGWGFTLETATVAIRFILSGVFEAYPNLKIILGHLGESLPFSLWRINQALSRAGNESVSFRELFCHHFWITTSGNFSTPALMCSLMEMGVDRILFSVDYPFVENAPSTEWAATIPLSQEDRVKILNGNARRLLKLG
jgi:predicted TIM-barrel fold metal-dependent hydrolase